MVLLVGANSAVKPWAGDRRRLGSGHGIRRLYLTARGYLVAGQDSVNPRSRKRRRSLARELGRSAADLTGGISVCSVCVEITIDKLVL